MRRERKEERVHGDGNVFSIDSERVHDAFVILLCNRWHNYGQWYCCYFMIGIGSKIFTWFSACNWKCYIIF